MKVEFGTPATSCRNNIRKFYLLEESPNYLDHDFPYRNLKLTPAGYQWRMTRPKRSRSHSPKSRLPPKFLHTHRRSFSVPRRNRIMGNSKSSKDSIGRTKVNWPRSGPLNVQLYPSRAIESTSIMHMNFLMNYVNSIKKEHLVYNVVAVADGGPDWSIKGIINLMAFRFLWEFMKLDTLTIQCYAPGHSRFNLIERSWSRLTKLIVGVILPVEIPELDYIIPKDNDDKQWGIILDKAVEECGKFWHGKIYDSFPITVNPLLSTNPILTKLKSIHSVLKAFSNTSKKIPKFHSSI